MSKVGEFPSNQKSFLKTQAEKVKADVKDKPGAHEET